MFDPDRFPTKTYIKYKTHSNSHTVNIIFLKGVKRTSLVQQRAPGGDSVLLPTVFFWTFEVGTAQTQLTSFFSLSSEDNSFISVL